MPFAVKSGGLLPQPEEALRIGELVCVRDGNIGQIQVRAGSVCGGLENGGASPLEDQFSIRAGGVQNRAWNDFAIGEHLGGVRSRKTGGILKADLGHLLGSQCACAGSKNDLLIAAAVDGAIPVLHEQSGLV